MVRVIAAYAEMWITDNRIIGKFTIFEIWKKKINMNLGAIIAIAVLTVALALVSYGYFLCRENLRRERKMNSVFYGLSRDLEGDTWRQKDTIQGQREEIESRPEPTIGMSVYYFDNDVLKVGVISKIEARLSATLTVDSLVYTVTDRDLHTESLTNNVFTTRGELEGWFRKRVESLGEL